MLFNSYIFMFVFLPITLIGYYGLNRWSRASLAWLVITSVLFYMGWNIHYASLLLLSILFNYLSGFLIQKTVDNPGQERRGSLLLFIGVAANVSLLFFYKYWQPMLEWFINVGVKGVPHQDEIILPLGISFFTFTQIGYLLDCKSGIARNKNPIDYALFVTFFPHLIAGPILHHREMIPQFKDAETTRFKPINLSVGLTLFILGLFKKTVIADTLSPMVMATFSHTDTVGPSLAWSAALAYTLQLYFDFSGYSDMAVGLARMFGIKFPANFNSPYKCTSIIEFWQHWHMTLTRYLNLYLYNPLAMMVMRRRVSKGKPVTKSAMRNVGTFLSLSAFPTFITMFLAGIWHGAGFTFLLFGMMHGTYLVINHAYRVWKPKQQNIPYPLKAIGNTISWILTFLAVIASLIMFRAPSVDQALHIYKAMIGLQSGVSSLEGYENDTTFIMLAFASFIVFAMPNNNQFLVDYAPVLEQVGANRFRWLKWKPNLFWGAAIAVCSIIAILFMGNASEFLYFKF